jgi:hypothetical protein
MIAFIDDHRAVYGVEPICNVLPGRVTQTTMPPENPGQFMGLELPPRGLGRCPDVLPSPTGDAAPMTNDQAPAFPFVRTCLSSASTARSSSWS